MRKSLVLPKSFGCLYYLDLKLVVQSCNAEETKLENEMLWHQDSRFRKSANEKLVEGLDYDVKKDLEFCDASVKRKLHRWSETDEPLGAVHSDVCGKINTKLAGGAEYFLTLTDDKALYVWVNPLKQKSDVFSCFLEWKVGVEKLIGLKTDN